MRNGFRIALATLLLAGCAQWAQRPVTAAQIDAWVAQRQFGAALAVLRNVPADHPQRALLLGKRARVEDQAHAYEDAVLADVRDKQESQAYAAALTELRTALHNYPQSTAFQAQQQDLLQEQQSELREVNEVFLLARTRALLEEKTLQERLLQLDPDHSPGRLREIDTQLEHAATGLLACGQGALQALKLKRAEQCLTLAVRIQDTAAARSALVTLKTQQARQKRATQNRLERSQDKSRRQQAGQLLADARAALTGGDLLEARQTLNELLDIDPDNPDAAVLRTEVDGAIDKRIAELLRQGNQLYRSGNIEQARRTWEEGLALDPGHEELRANVLHAERVLQNLRDLQQHEPVKER